MWYTRERVIKRGNLAGGQAEVIEVLRGQPLHQPHHGCAGIRTDHFAVGENPSTFYRRVCVWEFRWSEESVRRVGEIQGCGENLSEDGIAETR